MLTDDCPKCEAMRELLRQIAFSDALPPKVRAAYAAYRKAIPSKGCIHDVR